MRSTFVIAALGLPLVASAASAQVTGTVAINGTVANRCSLSINSQTISLGEMSQTADGRLNTAVVNGQNRTLTGFCNGATARMTVEAQPLLNPAAAAAGFDNRVDYTATAVANSVSGTDSSLASSPGAGSSVAVGAFAGNIVVTLSAASSPNNGVLVAGGYNGQVLVTLTPNVVNP